MHQSDNVALTFYLFSSPDAVERDRMHFTPKTYYYLASNFSAWRISLARHWFIVLTLRIRNWCPQCLGIVTQLRSLRYSEVIEFFKILVFQPNCVVILSRINTKRNYLELPDLSSLVPTCFCVQSSCAILNLPVFTALAFCVVE